MGRPSKYPDEFKQSAVEMVRETGKSIAEVARSLGMNEGTLGNWVMADRRRRGEQPAEKVSESERAELLRLRRENTELRMEKEILKKASPYLHDSFEGEAVLSIGKSVDLIEKGVSGIINAMPFGCMPGTVVTTLIRGVSREYGVPCTTVPFDGTESSTTEIQLEAFMNQAAEYDARRRNGRARR